MTENTKTTSPTQLGAPQRPSPTLWGEAVTKDGAGGDARGTNGVREISRYVPGRGWSRSISPKRKEKNEHR